MTKPVTTRIYSWAPPVIIAVIFGALFVLYNKSSDRFTGTQGKALKGQIQVIQESQREMIQAQEKAWKRIECRQIVFISANNRATEDFNKALESCK